MPRKYSFPFSRSSLLRRIWAANSLDFILDASLTVISVIFNYSVPFFMKFVHLLHHVVLPQV